jgi:hypothetical protein
MALLRQPRILRRGWESSGSFGGTMTTPLPGQNNIVHWYDFSDLTTTWQDEAMTSQAVAHEDEIDTIADKGYGGDNLTSGAATDPEVDLTTHIRPSAQFLNQSLNATIEAGIQAPWTHMAIAATEQTGNTQYITYWSSAAWVATYLDTSDKLNTHSSGVESAAVAADTAVAALAVWDNGTDVTIHYSPDAATSADENPNGTVAASQTMRIGASSAAAATEDFGGNIMEVIWWDYQLNASEIEQAKAYATQKWGVIWA